MTNLWPAYWPFNFLCSAFSKSAARHWSQKHWSGGVYFSDFQLSWWSARYGISKLAQCTYVKNIYTLYSSLNLERVIKAQWVRRWKVPVWRYIHQLFREKEDGSWWVHKYIHGKFNPCPRWCSQDGPNIEVIFGPLVTWYTKWKADFFIMIHLLLLWAHRYGIGTKRFLKTQSVEWWLPGNCFGLLSLVPGHFSLQLPSGKFFNKSAYYFFKPPSAICFHFSI